MKCSIYEQALSKQGVEWEYLESVPLEQIDAAKGLRNQARLEEPLDEQLVEAYALADRNGDQFPPVVLWRPGRGKWIPIDGNQRLAAKARNKRTETDAYAVKTTDQMIADRLTWSFNNLVNGKRLSPEEALQHAVAFVRKYGASQDQAAKEWGIPQHRVRNACRVTDLRDKLAIQGVKRLNDLSDDKLYRLAPLEKLGDDVLALAAAAVIENGLITEQCNELVNRVNQAKTHDAKLKAVAEYALGEEAQARRAETKGGRSDPKVLPRDKLASLLGSLVRLLEEYPNATFRHPVKAKFVVAKDQAQTVVDHLVPIFGLGALPRGEVG